MKKYNKHTTAAIRLLNVPPVGDSGGCVRAKEKRGEVRTNAEKHGRFLSRVYLLNLRHLYISNYYVEFKWIKR